MATGWSLETGGWGLDAGDCWLESTGWSLVTGDRWLVAGWLRLVAGGSGARAWLALGLGLGWLVTGVWSFAIQPVDWLVVQEGMVQCQGTGATGEWFLVRRLVMVVGCW